MAMCGKCKNQPKEGQAAKMHLMAATDNGSVGGNNDKMPAQQQQ
jgi:hypothetical protein